jgi:GNAT superfamily N-acetyltransferase
MPLDLEKIDIGGFGISEDTGVLPDDEVQAQANMNEALKINPDQHAQVTNLSKQSGVPEFAVESNPAPVEHQLKLDQIDFNEMSKRNPNTAKYLTDFNNSIIAQDDIDVLQSLEDAVTTVRDYGSDIATGFEKGGLTVEAAEIGLNRMYSVIGQGEAVTDEQIQRLQELEEQLASPVDDYGFIMGAPITAAEQLPIMGSVLWEGIKFGAGGAATGALVAGVPTLGRGAVAGAKFGGKLGLRFGIAKGAFDLEAGLAFNEFSALEDDQGNLMDPEIAGYAAATVGGINAVLEALSLRALGRTVTPVMKRLIKSRVKQSLATETGREVLTRLGKRYAEAVATETVTEGLQEFVTIVGGEVAKFSDEESFTEQNLESILDNVFSAETGERVLDAAEKGAQASILLAAPGVTVEAVMDKRQRERLSESEQLRIDAVNDISEQSKLRERDKESFKQFVEEADGDANTHVFIDGAQTSLYLQEKTPEEVEADPALKLLNEQAREAAVLGADVQVPIADFAAELVGTEHYNQLRDSMTMSTDGISPFRQEQVTQETESYISRLMNEAQENTSEYVEAQEIYTQVRDQLIDTGAVTPANASVMAQLVPAWATATARRQGKTVQQVYQESGLTIEGPTTGERARLEAEQVLTQEGISTADVQSSFQEEGVDVRLRGEGDVVTLDKIVVLKDQRETGIGTAAMQRMIDWADVNDKTIALTPSEDFGGTVKRLKEFYKRLGFVENKGRNKDFEISELMYRKPQRPELLAQAPVEEISTETEAFKAWSENGEVVEPEDVNDYEFTADTPVVLKVFHGTTHEFNVFDALRGNLEGQFGAINYFTSSEHDADVNYAGKGPDLTSRIERRAEELQQKLEDQFEEKGRKEVLESLHRSTGDLRFISAQVADMDDTDAAFEAGLSLARRELSGGEEQTMELFVKVKNPFVIGENTEWIEFVDDQEVMDLSIDRVAEDQGISVEEIRENIDEYDEQIDEVRWEIQEEQGHRLIDAIQKVSDHHGVEAPNLAAEVYDLGEIARPGDIEQLLRSSEDYAYAEGEMGELISSQLIAEVIEEMGFDSIILRNAEERFATMDMGSGTAHVHIFDSNKTNIKSVQNIGTFDPTDPNIFRQVTGKRPKERGYYDPSNSVIRLTEAADLSTFLHEFAHFMYEMEVNADTELLQSINNWYKRNAESVAKEANSYLGKEFDAEKQLGQPSFYCDVCDKLRRTEEGEAKWQRMMDTRVEISEEEFLSQVNIEELPVLDEGETWNDYRLYAGEDLTFYESDNEYFFQVAGFEFIWDKSTGEVLYQEESPPKGKEGSITPDDVVTYLDNNTTGDKDKDSAIRRAVHEQFARGFETYLIEGKSPSIELRNAFRTFARWLAQIYRAVRGQLGVQLDDEIRQAMDRLVATEEQIAAAEVRAKVEPMFTDATASNLAKMTEEEFADYERRVQKVKDVQSETLRDKIVKQLTRQTEKWWKEEKQDLIDEELTRLRAEQVYIAHARLRDGDLKLDHATVKEMVGQTKTDKRGRVSVIVPTELRGMTAKGQAGVHPDEAAAFFGYNSGSEMLEDLITAPEINAAAEVAAEARMKEIHGDILHDGTIEKEADEAVQNEERGKLLLHELKILARGTNAPTAERAAIKSLAEERIARLSFRQIHPGNFRKAEIRAAQEAASMLAAGNKEGAAQAKMRQVMNYYLGMAATDAKNETLKIVDRMGRYNKKKVREEIQKAEGGYWDQITKILDRFEFRKSATLTQVENINTWMRERIDIDGDGLVLSNAVLNESFVTHWKNVPFSELQGINDSVKNIEHVARYANKLTRMGEQIEFNKLVDRWVTSMDEKVKTRFKSKRTDVVEGRNWGRWLMSQMTKIPFMASWLDGGERVGLSHQILVQPMTEAYDAELRLWEEAAKPVMEAIDGRSKEDKKRHNRKIYIKEIDDNLYGHQVVAVALNTGNESNLKKLLLGEGWANPEIEEEIRFDNPRLQAVLSHMTRSDWEMVQMIWDQMDTLYPQLSEVHRRTTGLVPPKVEATPIATKFGVFNGGYYPVKYDPNRDHRAALNEDKLNAETESMFSNNASIQTTVNTGATNERTGYYAPIRLSLDVVSAHFQETIHYITHHDPVREINRLIRNRSVSDTIKEKLGPEEYAQLKPWLNDIAKDGREAPTKMFWDSILQRLRFGVTLGAMGFKASTGIIQISGLSNTMSEVGAKKTFQGITGAVGSSRIMNAARRILGSTTEMQSAWEFAVENSKVLAHRTQTMDREIKNAMKRIEGKRGILPAVQEASMKHIALIQTYMVDLPSWHAAYMKGMESWGDETRAFQYADWVIENVQGSGATKDMARIMRSQAETGRMFTMFMTFFSSLWNMERDLVKGAKTGRYSTTSVAAKAMFLFIIPVLFEMLMRDELGEPEDGEDERLQKLLTNSAMYPIQSVPFVRDVANAVTGEFGYNISPLQSIIEQGTQTIPEIVTRGFTDEEITKGQVKGATKFIGAATGIPGTAQAWATGEHLHDVIENGEEFTVHQLLFGPKRD